MNVPSGRRQFLIELLSGPTLRRTSRSRQRHRKNLGGGFHPYRIGLRRIRSEAAAEAWRGVQLAIKRGFDLGVAVPACILLCPFFAVIALAIKLNSSGPVFFVQTRRGLGFGPFTMVKFRSLHHAMPDPYERYEMTQSDARI